MNEITTLPFVSVIIATYNGLNFLRPCLHALQQQTYTLSEIIVVDDASTDGTVSAVRAEFPSVRIVALRKNGGFVKACNAGASAAKGDIFVMLNNDTEVEPTWLAELLPPFANPEVGSVASKMLLHDRRDTLHSAGDLMGEDGIPRNRGVWEVDRGQFDDARVIFGGCGGGVAYRRALWEEIGGFDDAFFMYLEDVDFAWRAQLRGWRAEFAPRARLYHHLSATGGGTTASYYTGRNTIWTLYKNMPARLMLRHWSKILLAQAKISYAAGIAGLRGGEAARARLRGQMDGLRTLWRMHGKRLEVQSLRRVSDEEIQDLLEK